MRIIKHVNGVEVELDLIKIRDYPRYTLYQIYRNGEALYKECYTQLQIEDIIKRGYVIIEEVFE